MRSVHPASYDEVDEDTYERAVAVIKPVVTRCELDECKDKPHFVCRFTIPAPNVFDVTEKECIVNADGSKDVTIYGTYYDYDPNERMPALAVALYLTNGEFFVPCWDLRRYHSTGKWATNYED